MGEEEDPLRFGSCYEFRMNSNNKWRNGEDCGGSNGGVRKMAKGGCECG